MISQWRKYQGVLISAKAPHHEVLTQNISSEIKKSNAFLARWITNFDCKSKSDFWYLILDKKNIHYLYINTFFYNYKIKYRLVKIKIVILKKHLIQ